MPAEAERAVGGGRVVGKGKLRTKALATGAGGERHRHRAASINGIGNELFADTAEAPPPLGSEIAGARNGLKASDGAGVLSSNGMATTSVDSQLLSVHQAFSRA